MQLFINFNRFVYIVEKGKDSTCPGPRQQNKNDPKIASAIIIHPEIGCVSEIMSTNKPRISNEQTSHHIP